MAKSVPTLKLADGREMPVVGLGTWKAPMGEVYNAVCHAIDIGYRHLDCALAYENESEIGKAIADKIAEGVVTREELFITSKCWNTYREGPRILKGLQKTLTDLRVDYLDLYLIHWPFSWKEGVELKDNDAVCEEADVDYLDVWKALEKYQKEGKIRSLGLSNFNSEQVARVLKEATVPPVTNQVECHVYLQQEKLRKFCEDRKIVLTAYCPLGRPYMPLKENEPPIMENPLVKSIGVAHSKSVAQVLLRFLVQRGIAVIPKSSNKERLASNFNIFDFELTNDEMDKLKALDRGFRILTFESSKDHKHYPFNIEF